MLIRQPYYWTEENATSSDGSSVQENRVPAPFRGRPRQDPPDPLAQDERVARRQL